ncbi:MAG: hypothetical protein PHT32_07950, partial [Candidatus Omnitrophica bacterium]|nr:hypothetical protein [Candidatus Omnitrophota bacterium]
MSKKYYAIILTVIVMTAVCLTLSDYAYAANGTRMLGFSTRDSGMGGATTASAGDTSCLVRNPAGLVRIGNRIDAEYQNILIHDCTMNTQGALARLGPTQESTINYLPGGNAGVSYRIPGTDKYPISVGVGAFTMAGVAAEYPSSRISGALVQVYDKMIDL